MFILAKRMIVLAAALILAAFLPLFAQGAPAAPQPPVAAPTTPVITMAAPPPASTFDPQAATEAYLHTIAGAARARSDAYFEGGYVLQAVDFAYALAVAGILLWGRFSARLRNWAERVAPGRSLKTALYVLSYFVVTAIMTLPLSFYEGFIREHDYGLSNQDVLGWTHDFAIQFAAGTILLTILITIFYAVMRRAGENWWKWATVIAIVFAGFVFMFAPVYIAPLLNKYTPLPDSPLKQEILSMARANGVPADNVYEFDASRQSKRISANVSGLLGTTRISLNDNLMNRSTPAEIKAVLGHEIGHYALGHSYTFLSWFAIVFFVMFGFIHWGFKRLTKTFGAAWDVHGIDDPAGLPLIFALVSFLAFVGTPVLNTMTRSIERQADIFGLNAARQPDGFATATLKLSEYRKLDPTPLEEIIFYDHPSGRSRISMAMQWKAEHLSDPDIAAQASPAPAPAP